MQSSQTLTLPLSLFEREKGTFDGTAYGSPNRDPRRLRSRSPLPARSGERSKVRGASDCIITDKAPPLSEGVCVQQSIVAQSCTLPYRRVLLCQTVGRRQRVGPIQRSAECNSAIQQIENLRYDPAPVSR